MPSERCNLWIGGAEPLDHTSLFLRRGAAVLEGLDGRIVIDVTLDLARSGAVHDALDIPTVAGELTPTATGEARADGALPPRTAVG